MEFSECKESNMEFSEYLATHKEERKKNTRKQQECRAKEKECKRMFCGVQRVLGKPKRRQNEKKEKRIRYRTKENE